MKSRVPARHIKARYRYLPVSFNGRPKTKGHGKPFVCDDCGHREKTEDDIKAHWWGNHKPRPKPVELEDIVCVSVSVEGE